MRIGQRKMWAASTTSFSKGNGEREVMGQSRGVEVYGHYSKPRVKWTCSSCEKRNDDALTLPIADIEYKFCKFCRKRFKLAFTKKAQRGE